MKKIISFVLAIMILTLPCLAETVYFDDNYESESFVVGATAPQYSSFNGSTYINRYGQATYTYGESEIGKTLDVTLAGKGDAGYYTIFTSNSENIIKYTKKGVILEAEFSITDGMRISSSFRAATATSGATIFYLDKNIFKVYNNGAAVEADTHKKEITPNEFHKLKVVIYTERNEFSVWIDGENVGGTNTISSNLDWSKGLYYMYISHGALNAKVLPAVAKYNSLSLKGYCEDGIEISSGYSLYENDSLTDKFSQNGENQKMFFDVFNNTSDAKSVLLSSMNYGKNSDDYSFIKGMKIKKINLLPGYNRVEANNLFIPEPNGTDLSKLYFLDSLSVPKLYGKVFSFTNDGTDISVVSE